MLAEAERFAGRAQMITADVDLERLLQERMRMTSFNDSVEDCRERVSAIRRVPFEFMRLPVTFLCGGRSRVFPTCRAVRAHATNGVTKPTAFRFMV